MKKFGAIVCALIAMVCAITAAEIHTAAGVNQTVVLLGIGFVVFSSAAASLWRSAREHVQNTKNKEAEELLRKLEDDQR